MNASPYLVVFSSSIRQTLRDRAGLWFRALFYVVILIVNSAVWYAATNGATREIHSYSHADLLWYIMMTETVIFAAPAIRIEQIGDDIATRLIETDMLRPTSLLGLRLASDVGTFLGRGVFLLAVGLITAPILAGEPEHYLGVLLALPAAFLAILCSAITIHLFAAISFWVRHARAGWFIFQKFIFLLGGMLFPIQFLPDVAETIAWMIPFWTMSYAPGSFVGGTTNWYLLAGQIAWITALFGLCHILFVAGERRLQAGL